MCSKLAVNPQVSFVSAENWPSQKCRLRRHHLGVSPTGNSNSLMLSSSTKFSVHSQKLISRRTAFIISLPPYLPFRCSVSSTQSRSKTNFLMIRYQERNEWKVELTLLLDTGNAFTSVVSYYSARLKRFHQIRETLVSDIGPQSKSLHSPLLFKYVLEKLDCFCCYLETFRSAKN